MSSMCGMAIPVFARFRVHKQSAKAKDDTSNKILSVTEALQR